MTIECGSNEERIVREAAEWLSNVVDKGSCGTDKRHAEALRSILPKPRFRAAEELAGQYGVRCDGDPYSGYVAGNIPTREQAERIAAIYNEEVGE